MLRRIPAIVGLALTAMTLAGCLTGTAREEVKEGFVMTVASYSQSGSDGTSKYVGVFRNVGAYADRAEFSVTLLPDEDADGPIWTGRGMAEDIAEGETVQVEMVSETPPPLNRESVVEFTAARG